MKKQFYTFFLAMLLYPFFALAQQENDPCSAPCLSYSGMTSGQNPAADGISLNYNSPCGAGTSEDNPTWYSFVPSGPSFTINVTVNGCSSGSSIEVTFFEGDDCGSVGSAGCLKCVTSGSLTLSTVPGGQYWIQVDGCNEAVCNYTLSYDPTQLLKTVPSSIVTGPTASCKGGTQEYTAAISATVKAASYVWTITPSSGGQVLLPNNENIVKVKWNNTGTYKLCVKPKFNVKCPPSMIGTSCLDVNVTELNTATCNLKLCPEQIPFDFPVLPCAKTANPNLNNVKLDPSVYTITQSPGTTKITSIPYSVDSSGCIGKVTLTTVVHPKNIYLLSFKSNIYLYANTPQTINLKELILKYYPKFTGIGTVSPATITLNEPKTGRFLKKIKYTVDNSICEGSIELALYVLNKNFLKSSLPQSEIRTEQQDENVEIDSEHPTLSIYPNPSDGIFNLDFLEENTTYEWEVFDTKGQLILKNKNTPNVDLQHASDGIYFLKIHSNDWIDTVKLIKY
jgi:Secretion system C-terminal sorting domain